MTLICFLIGKFSPLEQNLLELWVVFIATYIHTNYYWILMLKYSVWGKITLNEEIIKVKTVNVCMIELFLISAVS